MKHKSVPKTNIINQIHQAYFEIQLDFPFHLVRVDAEIQKEVAHLTPPERRHLADNFRRFAHQLEITASVLEKHSSPSQRRRLPRVSRSALPLN